jgi:hypothetical protein
MKLALAITIGATLMAGCASQLQAVKAVQESAVVSLRAAEDNNLDRLHFEICATPFSALVRHPELVPGVGALCLPSGVLSNPANLLLGIPAVIPK